MKPQIVKLDEAVLARMGFDRVTIAALRNMVRVTGVESDSPTVPQLAQSASETGQIIAALNEQISLLQGIIDIIQVSPQPESPDSSAADALALLPVSAGATVIQQVESLQTEVRQIAEGLANQPQHLQTEVRQIAESFATLSQSMQTEIRQIAEHVAQFSEHITTEVRHLADQQVVNLIQIQELKQGTML